MSFVWPGMLVLLLAVPFLIAGYVSLVRQRDHRARALAAEGFVPSAAAARRRRLRHVPFVFFLAAMVLLLIAFARPRTNVGLPHREGTVILAFDVSNSMKASDLKPTRMAAAKAAARRFVDRQPSTIKIGVVAFSGGGFITQEPTAARSDVLAAIDRLSPMGGTSLGQGIFTSINAVAGKPVVIDPNTTNLDDVDIGYYGSAAVVLLSDGENTSNPDPIELAKLASVAGLRIYPVGLGTAQGTVVDIDGFNVATKLDQDTLQQIASVSGGTYFNATSASELTKVYDNIDLKVTTEQKKTEITFAVTGVSIVLLVVGAALSLVWFGRLV
jgi:Ca-activated chloride channel family protein